MDGGVCCWYVRWYGSSTDEALTHWLCSSGTTIMMFVNMFLNADDLSIATVCQQIFKLFV